MFFVRKEKMIKMILLNVAQSSSGVSDHKKSDLTTGFLINRLSVKLLFLFSRALVWCINCQNKVEKVQIILLVLSEQQLKAERCLQSSNLKTGNITVERKTVQ